MNTIDYSSFMPNPECAKQLKMHMDQRLFSSMNYLRKKIGAAKTIPNFEVTGNVRGYAYCLHKMLLDNYLNDNYINAQLAIEKLQTIDSFIVKNPVITLSTDNLEKHILESYRNIIAKDDAHPLQIEGLKKSEFHKQKTLLSKALHQLKRASLPLYSEVKTYIKEVVIVQCLSSDYTFDSGSDFNCYSTTFINGSNAKATWLFYLESLVHEAAHMHLFALNTQDDLVSNSVNERYDAPLRKDKRTMSGVYHATFVVARIILAFRQIVKYCQLTNKELLFVLERINDYEGRFRASMTTINDHAKLSLLARKIINNSNLVISGGV